MNAPIRRQVNPASSSEPPLAGATGIFRNPRWPPWREETERRIEVASATNDLDSLVEAGCDREELLFRLAAIVAWQGEKVHWRSIKKMSRHSLKQMPKKMRDISAHIDGVQTVLSIRSFQDGLSQKIRASADELERDLWVLLKPNKPTLEELGICILVSYVEWATGAHKDKEVSELIGAVMSKDGYAATYFAQWRSKHRKDIESMVSTLLNPLAKSIPRT